METITSREIELEHVTLAPGNHASRDEGVCLMEAVAWFAGEDHSDRPACTDSVVAAYARTLNDEMPADQRQRLLPYISRLAGTRNDASPVARAMLCADRAVRVFAPTALREAGLVEWADTLAALPRIEDEVTARSAESAAESAAGDAAEGGSARTAARHAGDAAAGGTVWDARAHTAISAARAGARAAMSHAGPDPWFEPLRLLDDLIGMGAPLSGGK